MPEWDRPPEPRRRGGALVGAAGLVAAGAALVFVLDGDAPDAGQEPVPDQDGLVIEESTEAPDPVEVEEAPAPGVASVGAWGPLPAAPVPGRAGAVAVWTGEEALFWGGRDGGGSRSDGAAWDPSARTWRTLPDAPFPHGATTLSAFDGRRLVVVGRPSDGAAAYDPSSDRWDVLGSPPGDGRWTAIGALEGDVYVAGVHDGETAVVRLAANDDAWRPLPPPPTQGGAHALAGIGGHLAMIAAGPAGEEGLVATVFDPVVGLWQEAEAVPAGDNWTPAVAADGVRRLLLGGPSHERSAVHQMRAWSRPGMATSRWEPLPSLPRDLSRATPQLTPIGGGVLAWAIDDPAASAWLVGDNSGWVSLAAPPEPLPPGTVAAWTGRELVVWGTGGGAQLSLRPRRSVLLPSAGTLPHAGTWVEHGPPPDPRTDPTLAWTGGDLLVWGGRTPDDGRTVSGGYRWRPGTDQTRPVPAPPDELAHQPFVTSEAGSVVFAGGRSEDGWTTAAAVYTPGARVDQPVWRRLPPAPLPDGAAQVGGEVGGRLHLAAGIPARVVALDHLAGRWTTLPKLPDDAGAPTGIVSADGRAVVATERASWVLDVDASIWQPLNGPRITRADRLASAGNDAVAVGRDGFLVLRPGGDGWSPTARPLVEVEGGWPVWDGSAVVLWGAAAVGDHIGGRAAAGAYDPAADRWLVLPDPPQGVALGGPAIRAGRDVLFWSRWGVVTFRPDVGAALGPTVP